LETIKIAATGHRPKDLCGGYNLQSPTNKMIAKAMKEHLLSYLKDEKKVHAISGMALGTDTIFALVALELREEGYPVTLESAIPCKDHAGNWPKASQKQWKEIVDAADKVTQVSDQPYAPLLMFKRNTYMVNECDELLAVYNGSGKGGTANCVQYAEKTNKPIVVINPNDFVTSSVVSCRGDLLKSDCDIIMHQANCLSTMGGGIAKQIKMQFPEVYKVDAYSPLDPEEKLGKYTSAVVENNGKDVEFVNLYGQLAYGRGRQHTDYDALRSALFGYLSDKAKEVDSLIDYKIGLPKYIGCGLGGGDWSVVYDILEDAAKEFGVNIYTYEL